MSFCLDMAGKRRLSRIESLSFVPRRTVFRTMSNWNLGPDSEQRRTAGRELMSETARSANLAAWSGRRQIANQPGGGLQDRRALRPEAGFESPEDGSGDCRSCMPGTGHPRWRRRQLRLQPPAALASAISGARPAATCRASSCFRPASERPRGCRSGRRSMPWCKPLTPETLQPVVDRLLGDAPGAERAGDDADGRPFPSLARPGYSRLICNHSGD